MKHSYFSGKRRRPGLAHGLLALLLAQALPQAFALDANTLPKNGVVTSGAAQVSQSGSVMQVLQQSQNVALNWDQFNIGANAQVNFQQPNAQAVALNRVVGSEASDIQGRLTSNGQVFLINPNGVLFGPGAKVNVGGLVASTLDISEADFAAGRYRFANGGGAGSVVNQGELQAAGGYIALFAPEVRNEGVIQARLGSVALAAGNRITLDVAGPGLLNVAVDEAALNAQVSNRNLIVADGGQVLMSARAAGELTRSVVNQEGIIRATTVNDRNGVIRLEGGSHGVVSVSGTLDASGNDAGEKGGRVQVLGEKVGLFGTARVDVSGQAGGGEALIGGNYQGQGPEQNATATYMAAGASIDADAKQTGNGGRVILWADDLTRFYGSISARGGAVSGNGGFVETSGKNFLTAAGRVDASAQHGTAGRWLLDPRNVTIVQSLSGGGTYSGGVFTPTADDALVSADTISASLNNGTSVTITTGADGTQAGEITLEGGVTIRRTAAGGDVDLRFSAANNVNLFGNIISEAGAGRINFIAQANNQATGDPYPLYGGIQMRGADIRTNGGNVILGGRADPARQGAEWIEITDSTSIDAGGGNISIRASALGTYSVPTASVMIDSGMLKTSGTGSITIVGDSRQANGSTPSIAVAGVRLVNGTSLAAGSLSVKGYGGGTGNASNNTGVEILDSQLTSTGGIQIEGYGGAQAGTGANHGIFSTGATLTAANDILLYGSAGGSGLGSGVGLSGNGSSPLTKLVSQSGIFITGASSYSAINLDGTGVSLQAPLVVLASEKGHIDAYADIVTQNLNVLISDLAGATPYHAHLNGASNDIDSISGFLTGGLLLRNTGALSIDGFEAGGYISIANQGTVTQTGALKINVTPQTPGGGQLNIRVSDDPNAAIVLDDPNNSVSAVHLTAKKNVIFTADGSYQVMRAEGDVVRLESVNGALLGYPVGYGGPQVVAATSAELRAYGRIGDDSNVIDVAAPRITVSADCWGNPSDGHVSVNLTGSAGDGVIHYVRASDGSQIRPAGQCLFNGTACAMAVDPLPGAPSGAPGAAGGAIGFGTPVAQAAKEHLRRPDGTYVASAGELQLAAAYPADRGDVLAGGERDSRLKTAFLFRNEGQRLPEGVVPALR